MMRVTLTLTVFALVAACATDVPPAGAPGGDDGPPGRPPGDDGPPPPDEVPPPDPPMEVPSSCRHLDIVFSIDPSGSMDEELEFLRDTIFPELARTLRTLDDVEDFRVGVMDSCWDPPELHTSGRDGDCAFSSGQPWIDSRSPSMEEEFACVGNMHGEDDAGYGSVSSCTGSGSDNEHPATAAMYAIEAAAAGTANAGFLRDDSVLVVFAMTDEDEQPERGPGPLDADAIFERIVAAKGDPRAVAFLGVGGATDCDGVYGRADEAVLLKETTARFAAFDRGLFWDLCGGNLQEGLARVVELIQRACEELPDPCDEFMPGSDLTDCYGNPDDPDEPDDEPPLI